MSEQFYTDLAGKTRDANSKSLLNYLASMEHSHLAILEAEYKQFQLGEDINSDDYLRGERLMNLGP
jgi:rubrerythrin